MDEQLELPITVVSSTPERIEQLHWRNQMMNPEAPDVSAVKPEEMTDEVRAAIEKTLNTEASVTSRAHVEPAVPADRKFVVERIGNIAYMADGHHYAGCRLIEFEPQGMSSSADQMNDYFTQHGNLLVVKAWMDSVNGNFVAMVTNTLSEEQMEIVKTRSTLIDQEVNKLMKEKQAAQKAAEAKVETEYQRLKELADAGEHCKANHGAVIKQMKAAKKGKKE